MIRLTLLSLWSRKTTVALMLLTLAMSVGLFITVEHLRKVARESFEGTVSGVDVVVGGRTSDLGLLLSTVFQLGEGAPPLSQKAFDTIAEDPRVAWAVPISLGDSHRGFPVLATEESYFEHVKTGRDEPLELVSGAAELDNQGAVLGARVARDLGYVVGSELIVQHGLVSAGHGAHDEDPFTVTGVLAPTNTPLDFNVFVNLAAFDALHGVHGDDHADEHGDDDHAEEHGDDDHADEHGDDDHADEHGNDDHTDEHGDDDHADEHGHDDHADEHSDADAVMSGALVGLVSKPELFRFIEDVEASSLQPISAVSPNAALSQLWALLGGAEAVLRLLSALILGVALIGLIALLIASLQARRREIAIYRAMGAQPVSVAGLLVLEALAIGIGAAVLGWVLAVIGSLVLGTFLTDLLRLDVGLVGLSGQTLMIMTAFVMCSGLAGLIPALLTYRSTLQDGLRPRQ